jgi:hypothetical protein
MKPNQLKRDLKGGKVCVGTVLTIPSPTIADIASRCGFDWVWVGMEHTPLSYESVQTMLQAITFSVRCAICGGYAADESTGGTVSNWGPFQMTHIGNGVWATDPGDPQLADFRKFDHVPYMYRVTKDDGTLAWRADLFPRC